MGEKGQPGGAGCVENGIEDRVGRGGNPVQRLRDGEGVGKVGLVRVKVLVTGQKGVDSIALTLNFPLSDHFQDKKIPVHESLVTQCCPGVGMVVLIQ